MKPKHMLFNAVIIALVGGALESRLGVWPFLTVGLIGGALGQLAGAWAYPHAFISGASQAYLPYAVWRSLRSAPGNGLGGWRLWA
ncbi:MAG: rhomboid family intramembrane serine protease [Proteobacteria bacterium]|nr:rhomboid family intramembrane serine protease [Pseudomonadota bacterium]